MKVNEVVHRARLEGVYGVARRLQALHDKFETRCIGSGNCCRIGLVIPLAECWHIAKSLREDYWKIAEDKGMEDAETYWRDLVSNLKAAMARGWNSEDGTYVNQEHCVFFNGGCGIYGYRPFICRAYGVFAPVQEGTCPRKRLPDGGHELIRDDSVLKLIEEFDSIISAWGEQHPDLDFSIYMPAGVLKFILPDDEFMPLMEQFPDKFMGHQGYQHQLHEYNSESLVTIRNK